MEVDDEIRKDAPSKPQRAPVSPLRKAMEQRTTRPIDHILSEARRRYQGVNTRMTLQAENANQV
jgi:hypothetical protein